MSRLDYKPIKTAFLARRLVLPLLVIFILTAAVIAVAAGFESGLFWALVPLLGVAIFLIADANVAYRKQSYGFRDRAILYATGNLFSDKETELKYRNITHVRLIKPFIEYKLFGTGRILIEAAGSSGSEVVMQSVADPETVYKQIQATMAEKDFSLQYARLLSREQPAKIAVALEILGGVAGTFFTLALLAPGLIGLPLAVIDILPAVAIVSIALVAGLAVFGGGIFYVYVLYQDLIRRTYYIYDDVICYERGFLTKQQAFIPVENLSDSEVTQNFLDKILNLYDVIISCQGSGSEIPFRNLRNGKEVERVIDGLINKTDPLVETAQSTVAPAASSPSKAEISSPTKASDVQANYKMNITRSLVQYAPIAPLFILFPPLLLVIAYTYIVAKRTDFRLTAKGVASYFTFLTTRNIEFTSDKIMAVIVKRNLIDRWLSTCTVEFWSIGSTSAVVFRHIDDMEGLEPLMKEKAGIPDDPQLEQLQPKFGFSEFIKANLYANIFILLFFVAFIMLSYWSRWLLLPAGLIVVGYLAVVFVLGRRYRRARLRYGTKSVSYRVGWLREVRYYALYANIKDATITAYPFSRRGTVKFNIAGEQAVQTGNSGVQYRPNSFSVAYVQNPDDRSHIHDHILDLLLFSEPDVDAYQQTQAAPPPERNIIMTSRPSLKNAMVAPIIAHVILLPTVVLLPITWLIVRFWVRRISYNIEADYRTYRLSGVLYRKQTSIIFPKLDYIKRGQRFTNKMFRNGNIHLYTTGSRDAELTFTNLPDYKEFHQELKRQYER